MLTPEQRKRIGLSLPILREEKIAELLKDEDTSEERSAVR
jgi:hypothetical protein